MTPDQFLTSLKQRLEPAYLFLGPEAYQRDRCRRALTSALLGPDDPGDGLTRLDLEETPLAAVIDDARALSLFAPQRLIWISRAEGAVPQRDAAEDAGSTVLDEYLKAPTPGTVLVFDAARFDFDSNEDKAKLERVEKFYAAIQARVEFRAYSPEAARSLAQILAKQVGLQLPLAELAALIDATGGDASRLAIEIEKLSLLTGGERKVTADDIAALVPDAHEATIFALVAALGRGDRARSLEILDILAREGEYMPLALTFLATQFRLALAVREAGVRGPSAIQNHFNRLGVRVWAERARQIEQTVDAFPKDRLAKAVEKLYATDRGLRDARPDDRIVMEEMILALT